jgi:hypothetical protein
MDLLNKVLPDKPSASHAQRITRTQCEWQLPDSRVKMRLWNEIISPDNKDSFFDYNAKCKALMQRYIHFELLDNLCIVDEIYQQVPAVLDSLDR